MLRYAVNFVELTGVQFAIDGKGKQLWHLILNQRKNQYLKANR